ncbi:hypothetical protein [Arthrobacter mangrovi]|uniref:Uncharacterized protein n=1 Tax=Arthrobacter mangrovi TaxID=2966350 RepID=A0ABQ5MXA1_9MICC|nr:hypothetical protein [Arthrobacter mangrovi]GLB68410.1 hypothetical protein AHIS1636_28520 [Arthrobacter mangrovi]
MFIRAQEENEGTAPLSQDQEKKSYRLQLAGVWIGAASLALALAKAILDLLGIVPQSSRIQERKLHMDESSSQRIRP